MVPKSLLDPLLMGHVSTSLCVQIPPCSSVIIAIPWSVQWRWTLFCLCSSAGAAQHHCKRASPWQRTVRRRRRERLHHLRHSDKVPGQGKMVNRWIRSIPEKWVKTVNMVFNFRSSFTSIEILKRKYWTINKLTECLNNIERNREKALIEQFLSLNKTDTDFYLHDVLILLLFTNK